MKLTKILIHGKVLAERRRLRSIFCQESLSPEKPLMKWLGHKVGRSLMGVIGKWRLEDKSVSFHKLPPVYVWWEIGVLCQEESCDWTLILRPGLIRAVSHRCQGWGHGGDMQDLDFILAPDFIMWPAVSLSLVYAVDFKPYMQGLTFLPITLHLISFYSLFHPSETLSGPDSYSDY